MMDASAPRVSASTRRRRSATARPVPRRSCAVSSATWRRRIATRAGDAGERRPRQQLVQPPSSRCRRARSADATPSRQGVDVAGELVLAPHDELGGRRWRRRAQVGDEVGDGDVGLVADRGDDRHRRGGDRPGDGLFVERPEILERSAAAADDDHVDAVDARRPGAARGRSRPPRPRPARAPAR